MTDFDSLYGTDFVAHPFIRGGHLQTLWSLTGTTPYEADSQLHWVELDHGDRLALIEDQPASYVAGNPCMLIVHGICGSSESNYMHRLASRFTTLGMRVFRLNLRGCGIGSSATKTITHAGRSDDVLAALAYIARLVPEGPYQPSASRWAAINCCERLAPCMNIPIAMFATCSGE